MHYGSIGLGIQSTAMALKSINGEIEPRPEAFIFADTGWERDGTYQNLELMKERAADAGIPFFVVSNGNIREDALHPTRRSPSLPYRTLGGRIITVAEQREKLIKTIEKQMKEENLLLFNQEELKNEAKAFDKAVKEGKITDYFHKGRDGIVSRQCTYDYKIAPTLRKIKEHAPIKPTKSNQATLWIGFSIDEVQRMSPPKVQYLKHRFPLIELKMDRAACERYLIENDYPVPCRSSCIGCPFHADHEWQQLSMSERLDVEDFERRINEIGIKRKNKPSIARNRIRLHPSLELIENRPYEKNKNQMEMDIKDQTCGAGCFL